MIRKCKLETREGYTIYLIRDLSKSRDYTLEQSEEDVNVYNLFGASSEILESVNVADLNDFFLSWELNDS